MIHVTLPQLCAFLDDELAESSAELVRRHLSECLECTERFGRMEEQDEVLGRILNDEPAEEFFEQLCASIPLGQAEAKKAEAPGASKQTRPSPGAKGPVPGAKAPPQPTKSAPLSKPEPAARPAVVRSALPAPARPRRRAEDRERAVSGMTAAMITAGVCLVVAASVAWVALRPRHAEAPAPPESARAETGRTESPPVEEAPAVEPGPTPEELLERSAAEQPIEPPAETSPPAEPSSPEPAAPENLIDRAPRHFVPVRKVITQTIIERPAKAPAPLPSPPPVAPKPDPAAAVRSAKSASLEAAKTRAPEAFDRSADAWARAIPLLENAPETLALARREWAQARFQAWAAEPTAARRDSAIAATRQYLLYAPPGPERDQAWTWLGRLKH